jgi:hypothetical protein
LALYLDLDGLRRSGSDQDEYRRHCCGFEYFGRFLSFQPTSVPEACGWLVRAPNLAFKAENAHHGVCSVFWLVASKFWDKMQTVSVCGQNQSLVTEHRRDAGK